MSVFEGCGDLRALHSFPTRRSSDLFGGHRRRVGEQLFAPRAARGHIDGGVEASVRQRARQDRKSTRLNSSHVEISYAVFCLKKKIEKPAVVRASATSRRQGPDHQGL